MKTRLFLSLLTFASLSHAATLTVHVKGLRQVNGQLLLAVHGGEENYSKQTNPAALRRIEIKENPTSVVIPDLPAGDYVVSLIHDSNNNGKLDTNFVGMPTEGWGFSNNVGARGRPSYSEAKFTVADTGADITIQLF